MSDLFWLSRAQIRRIEPYFPLSHGIARVDDQRVISGIIFVIRNGLRWRDAPKDYGPHKTIYKDISITQTSGEESQRFVINLRSRLARPAGLSTPVHYGILALLHPVAIVVTEFWGRI
jgi:transposase